MRDLVDLHYPDAKYICVVQDNLGGRECLVEGGGGVPWASERDER
jgi:hypothetical protein